MTTPHQRRYVIPHPKNTARIPEAWRNTWADRNGDCPQCRHPLRRHQARCCQAHYYQLVRGDETPGEEEITTRRFQGVGPLYRFRRIVVSPVFAITQAVCFACDPQGQTCLRERMGIGEITGVDPAVFGDPQEWQQRIRKNQAHRNNGQTRNTQPARPEPQPVAP